MSYKRRKVKVANDISRIQGQFALCWRRVPVISDFVFNAQLPCVKRKIVVAMIEWENGKNKKNKKRSENSEQNFGVHRDSGRVSG